MYPSQTIFLIFLLWFESVQNQCWNAYSVGTSSDPYTQLYIYGQPGYDYTQYLQVGYSNAYSQPNIYDYQQYGYNNYQDDTQRPIIIILNEEDRDDEWELLDIISFISSLKDKSDDGPIYIPYPVLISCCSGDYNDFDWDFDCCSDCGCKNKGKCSSCKKCNNVPHCDCGDCCEYRKKGRSKSKCHCSGNSRSNSDRGRCNKYDEIKHKSDCSCRC